MIIPPGVLRFGRVGAVNVKYFVLGTHIFFINRKYQTFKNIIIVTFLHSVISIKVPFLHDFMSMMPNFQAYIVI